MRNEPLVTIRKLIKERYVDAQVVFWAGSVSEDSGTSASDLDLVIVYESIPNAYREAFVYKGWPIDAFIHDLDTLRYFFEESRTGNGISGLSYMILKGHEVTDPCAFSENVKILAQEVLNAGPAKWNQKQIDKERFLITDVFEDIKYPVGHDEQIASAAWLLEALGQFYFRIQNKWCATGKSIIRYLKNDSPDLAKEFTKAFESVFQTGDASGIESAVTKILAPHGGLLWDGFRSDAPTEWRLSVKDNRIVRVKADDREKIYALEISLLDPQVRKNIKELDRLIADNFYEIGASGKVYNKNNVLAELPLEQNDDSLREVIDFEIDKIAEYLIRANYILEENTRRTRRTSIWQRQNDNYQMIFHQGRYLMERVYDIQYNSYLSLA